MVSGDLGLELSRSVVGDVDGDRVFGLVVGHACGAALGLFDGVGMFAHSVVGYALELIIACALCGLGVDGFVIFKQLVDEGRERRDVCRPSGKGLGTLELNRYRLSQIAVRKGSAGNLGADNRAGGIY